MMLAPADRRGILETFGHDVVVKGATLRARVERHYDRAGIEGFRIQTRAPRFRFDVDDVRALNISNGDSITLVDDTTSVYHVVETQDDVEGWVDVYTNELG